MIILEAKDIKKSYGRGKANTEALGGVSFCLEKGEILGIVGESGSGKSTLLRMLAGLEAPDRGSIFLYGEPVQQRRTKEQRRQLQMIFQSAGTSFNPRRRVESSIRASVRSLCTADAEPDMEKLCQTVGLAPELARRYPGALSGGQCQRFAIARALASGPEILLCDEVTSALDVSTQAQILHLIADICRKRGMSAVFVSHDISAVSCLCSRIIVMREGKIVENAPACDIINSPGEAYTRLLISSILEV